MRSITKTFIGIFLIPVVLSSCQETYEAPKSATQAMAGRWYIELFADPTQTGVPDPAEIILAYEDFGQYGLVTTNTAANDADSVIITDQFAPASSLRWPFKIVSAVNLGNLKFTNTTGPNIHSSYIGSGETVTVIEGEILKGAGHAKSGRAADSIRVVVEFSDDPGNHYIYSGHRDSGQPEDQYH